MTDDRNIQRYAAVCAVALLLVSGVLGLVWTLGQEAEAQHLAQRLGSLDAAGSEAEGVADRLSQLRRSNLFDWAAAIAAVACAAGLVPLALGRAERSIVTALAAVPAVYLLLASAPTAVTGELMSIARLVVAAGAVAAYLVSCRGMAKRQAYVMGTGVAGVLAVFFLLWEPPPPVPVPLARPLIGLEEQIKAQFPGWTGRHVRISPDVEAVLGADEYLNLELESPDKTVRALVFITYNANAMTNIPHVPWVCMVQSGFRLVELREEDYMHPTRPGKELKINVITFEPGPERPGGTNAMMFQYFNVGGQYIANRQLARLDATSGSLRRRGSYLSQTQVAVWFPASQVRDPMAKTSEPYRTAAAFVNVVVPLLERDYYPDLGGAEGG